MTELQQNDAPEPVPGVEAQAEAGVMEEKKKVSYDDRGSYRRLRRRW